jgi:hypothetical protein
VPEIAAPPAVVIMVPVASGSVSVLFVLLFGLAIVNMPVPLALPCIDTLDIISP